MPDGLRPEAELKRDEHRPTPLSALGRQLVRLGQAMQNPNTKLGELTELVQACGVDLRICDTNKESRA
ncbi:hypothetical protein GHV70_08795 [Pseudomonas aeruginosa]|nr:hypothetical protein [Pseudomonas aeruginosa]